MALLADKSADAGSNLVQGTGASSLSFPMPGNVQLDVESVVATIDNTAGGDTFATLVVRDVSGEVIATKRQSEAIPAGDTGTATWSLRDAADGGASTATGFIKFDFLNVGDWLKIRTTGQVAPTVANGIVLEAAKAIVLDSDEEVSIDAGTDLVTGSTGDTQIIAGGDILLSSSQAIRIEPTTDLRLDPIGAVILSGGTLGAFGATPVPQQATPVTLGDVIALLQAFGFAA